MTTLITPEDHLNSLKYFHQERGDMKRYIHFDEAIKLFPDIKRALADVDYHTNVLNMMLDRAEVKE